MGVVSSYKSFSLRGHRQVITDIKIEKGGYVKQNLEKLQDNSTLAFRPEYSAEKRLNKQLRQLVGSGIKSTVSQDYGTQHPPSEPHHTFVEALPKMDETTGGLLCVIL